MSKETGYTASSQFSMLFHQLHPYVYGACEVPFLPGTMQAISRLLLVSLLGRCRTISAEPCVGGSEMCPKNACLGSGGGYLV